MIKSVLYERKKLASFHFNNTNQILADLNYNCSVFGQAEVVVVCGQ